MSEVYRIFSKDWEHCLDYSDQSLRELYYSETHGDPVLQNNGFYVGKKYLNLSVAMWKEDMEKGCLFKQELYNDPKFPHWWLDKVFKK
jgi:hypothetical protein